MQPQKNIRVDNGRLFGSGTSWLPITEISGWMRHWRDGVMGGDVRCGDLEWKQRTMAPASLLLFFSPPPRPAAVITQPNPLGGLSRLKSRKIVQLSGLWAGEGVGRVEWGRWRGTLGLCAAGTRCVYTTQQLVAGLLWTHTADDRDNRQALICCLSLLCILAYFNPPPPKKIIR